ncbi:Transposable element Tc1 transposase [Araneus ventricosus]|uniref:Transposable element Tc1 transposase n=1 Tax=Araneus ventricosus TaxID=182803 RepID=A0A4Y2LQ23_ARAVE|nr:Transposable element Tc1 transposase [Araneus ventricosus]
MEYRHEIFQLADQDHLTEREIAHRLDLSVSTVHYWVSRRGKRATTKSGRPRKTRPETDQVIYQASLQNPFLTAVDLRHEHAPECCIQTVRNRLQGKGLKCRVPARKPFLQPFHRQMRQSFALNHLHWSVDAWHRVVFSDEKIFRASSRGALRVYRPKRGSDRYDDQYIVPSSNIAGQRLTLCVWMAFGGQGALREIHRIEQRTLNAQYYTSRILPTIEHTLSEEDLIFMQDLSSIHTSRLTDTWLNEHNINVMRDWPVKGPDMNPVENIWAELVRRIELRTRESGISNRNQLWENIQFAFDSLPQDYFNNLINSMPRRVGTVNRKHGGWTKY